MLKIRATVKLKDEKTKTCSFQKKEDTKISLNDIKRIIDFVYGYTNMGYRVELKWRIDYNRPTGSVAGISSGEPFIKARTEPERFDRLVKIINNHLH